MPPKPQLRAVQPAPRRPASRPAQAVPTSAPAPPASTALLASESALLDDAVLLALSVSRALPWLSTVTRLNDAALTATAQGRHGPAHALLHRALALTDPLLGSAAPPPDAAAASAAAAAAAGLCAGSTTPLASPFLPALRPRDNYVERCLRAATLVNVALLHRARAAAAASAAVPAAKLASSATAAAAAAAASAAASNASVQCLNQVCFTHDVSRPDHYLKNHT